MEKITAAFCFLAVMGVFSATGDVTSIIDGNDPDKGSTISSTTNLPSKDNQTFSATTEWTSPDSDNTTKTSGTSKKQWTSPDSDNTTNTTWTSENPSTPGPESETTTTLSTKTSKKVMTKSTTTQKTQTPSMHNPTDKPNTHKKTYITILIIIIICILSVMAFCCVQNKTRKFSLERHSKNEDAQIPLSAVDPEVFEAASLKGMQTFTAVEDSATPADGVEKQDGDKAPEDNQQEKEGSTDTQDTAPLTEKVGELTVVDLNDGEPTISTKTSVESLDEPLNENNSNNRAQASAYGTSGNFTEICLNDLH